MNDVRLILGDCLVEMGKMEPNSTDTVITDPPAGISFMGKKWDDQSRYDPQTEHARLALEFGNTAGLQPRESGFLAFTTDWAAASLRVLKPGGTALVWALPRTSDLTGLGLRIAGYELRDIVTHIFGSGFPKSYDIGQSLEKKATIGKCRRPDRDLGGLTRARYSGSEEGTLIADTGGRVEYTDELAQLWDGWKTGLKPAVEFWIVAMKPIEKTFANNALVWGVSGLNIDGGRIETNGNEPNTRNAKTKPIEYNGNVYQPIIRDGSGWDGARGRYPANLLLECNCGAGQGGKHAEDCVCGMLDRQSGVTPSGARPNSQGVVYGKDAQVYGDYAPIAHNSQHDDKGGCSRYFKNIPADRLFYCPKASRRERNEGLGGMEERKVNKMNSFGDQEGFDCPDGAHRKGDKGSAVMQNHHATVKPVALMEYLCTLTKTPTGGIVLDPFMGSGTTGCAAANTDRPFIGIELLPEYFAIAYHRIKHAQRQPRQLEMEM